MMHRIMKQRNGLCSRLATAIGVVALATGQTAVAATVSITFAPDAATYQIGDSFIVNWIADISSPVVGWGLDLTFDSTVVALNGTMIGPIWFPVAGSESDDYGGLAFPNAVSGSGVLLTSLSFTAIAPGSTNLSASFDPLNFAEGFALEQGGFADLTFANGSVAVNPGPEPAPVILVASVIVGMLGLRFITRLRRTSSSLKCRSS